MPNDADQLPSVEEERRAFHLLVNIENNRDFEPTARQWATSYLAAARFDADELFKPFEYTVPAFRDRLQAIYDQYVPGMHATHPYDRSVFRWSNGKRYPIGPFSDEAVKDRLLQMAPFNLTDGAWLQHVVAATPIDEVRARLFDIWADEAGNGNVEENHCNVYDTLLKNVGIYLPPVTDAAFIECDFVPSAWRSAVFELCVGLFPQEFFPELLGMTLYLEWEATPTMLPMARLLERRGMNPLFYRLHMAIDNISNGHGALAREAVESYMAQRLEEGGQAAAQQSWERIWSGYVTWATIGFAGDQVIERALQIDRKQINIGTPQAPECWPDLEDYYHRRAVDLIKKKASKARQVHEGVTVGGQSLNQLFAGDPARVLELLQQDGYFDLERPRSSRFFTLTEFGGPMYRVFADDEIAIILDWIESLSMTPHCVDPIAPNPAGGGAGEQMRHLIDELALRAAQAHDGIVLETGEGSVPLATLFEHPLRLMAALAANGWVVPGSPARSMFFSRVLSNGGPMDGVLTSGQRATVEAWIRDGAPVPAAGTEAVPASAAATDEAAVLAMAAFASPRIDGADTEPEERTSALTWRRPYIGQGGVH